MISEEEKIINLENEISFLKDALCEKQKEIECEYCKKGEGKSILHDEEYNTLNVFIKNGLLWEKTYDIGVEINYCPICGRKLCDY